YVQRLASSHSPGTHPWLRYADISRDATLDFTMGAEPNQDWGAAEADAPPSFANDFQAPPRARERGPNLAAGKAVTSSMPCALAESAANAVEGSLMHNSKWGALAAAKWLQVDLGAVQPVGAFVLKHAALGGES